MFCLRLVYDFWTPIKKRDRSNVKFFEVRNCSLSDEYLSSLCAFIKGNISDYQDPVVLFCGLGNSMLKARGNRELDVLGGRPIHISGQVSQISDHEF